MLESQIQHRKEAIEDIKQWVTSLYSAWLHKFGFPSNVVYKRIRVDLWAKTIFISIKSIPHITPVYAEAVIYVPMFYQYLYIFCIFLPRVGNEFTPRRVGVRFLHLVIHASLLFTTVAKIFFFLPTALRVWYCIDGVDYSYSSLRFSEEASEKNYP